MVATSAMACAAAASRSPRIAFSTLNRLSVPMTCSPRRKGSKWSPMNRALARTLIAAGRMTPAGYEALPDDMKIPTLGKKA